MSDARTKLRAFAVVGINDERTGAPTNWITIKKVVYTKEAADDAVAKANAKADGVQYFWQSTSIEPIG